MKASNPPCPLPSLPRTNQLEYITLVGKYIGYEQQYAESFTAIQRLIPKLDVETRITLLAELKSIFPSRKPTTYLT